MIGNKLKVKLIAEPGIPALHMDVDVHNGVVTLSGIVETEAQKKSRPLKSLDVGSGQMPLRLYISTLTGHAQAPCVDPTGTQ
jgi:hypothetical protein